MKAIMKKLHTLQHSIHLPKDMKVTMGSKGSYSARSEEGVVNAILPVLNELGLVITVEKIEPLYCDKNSMTVKVTQRVTDIESEEFILFESIGSGSDNGDKQAGKAYTYAVKNGLIKLAFMVSGEDTDNESSDSMIDKAKATGKSLIQSLFNSGYFKGLYGTVVDEAERKKKQEGAFTASMAKMETIGTLEEVEESIKHLRAKYNEIV